MTIFSVILLTGCSHQDFLRDSDLNFLTANETYEKEGKAEVFDVQDNNSLYSENDEVKVLYLTVGQGSKSDGTNHTWNEVNTTEIKWFEKEEVSPYKCEAVVQLGNEIGPVLGEFGYGVTTANATVKLNGYKASERAQKSYRINIKTDGGNIDGMKSFVLSKSFTDPFRFTNKLCYELMEEIPQLLSTRTYFVHLYVKDVSESRDTKFVDYGLYTMIEPITKKYFSNRNLDKTGEIYKIVDFDWKRHKNTIVQATDADYDKDKFEKLLESKGSNDYSKLLVMLDAVNDESISITDVIENYFDEDNLYTWMAFNILVDNKDTDTENYYIYSPTGMDKFYFISWDNDGAFRSDYEKIKDADYDSGWKKGAFVYNDSVLFKRILDDEYCVGKLTERVDELHEGVMSGENVMQKAKQLAEITKKYVYDLPDRSYARVTSSNYDLLLEKLSNQIDENYYNYYQSIEGPWPFHINNPKMENGEVILNWDMSSAVGMDVTYSVQVDNSWDFNRPMFDMSEIKDNTCNIGHLEKGQYFVKVTAVSDNGHEQEAIEYYNTEKKTKVNGVLCFYVLDDGSVVESLFE